MLRNQTLFVVGAGASNELDLPLGNALADKIASKLHFEFEYGSFKKGDYYLFSAMQQHFNDNTVLNKHLMACSRIRSGIKIARSIDNYIDTHRDDPEVALCGKIAIVDCIASSEKLSKLYFEPHSSKLNFDIDKLGKSWVIEFVNILFDGVPKSNIASVFDNLSIISFNYDRCIQQALLLALHTQYHFDLARCHELVGKLQIIHPYGSLGALPSTQNSNAIAFGEEIYRPRLFELYKGIRTYSEQIADADLVKQISDEVIKAKTVVFLGCAYHTQNVQILSSKNAAFEKTFLGTAFDISDDGVRHIATRLLETIFVLPTGYNNFDQIVDNVLGKQFKLRNDLKCYEFMKEYRQSLIR